MLVVRSYSSYGKRTGICWEVVAYAPSRPSTDLSSDFRSPSASSSAQLTLWRRSRRMDHPAACNVDSQRSFWAIELHLWPEEALSKTVVRRRWSEHLHCTSLTATEPSRLLLAPQHFRFPSKISSANTAYSLASLRRMKRPARLLPG